MDPTDEVWAGLSPPRADGSWRAVPFLGIAKIARTGDAGIAVLIPGPAPRGAAHGLRTHHIEYQPTTALEMELPDGTQTKENHSVLECASTTTELSRHFLRLVSLALPSASFDSTQEFDQNVRLVFELFRRVSGPASKTIQGLWAELFLILEAKDSNFLARAYHSEPNEVHDFVDGVYGLEVKSTTNALREHHFSLEQLEYRPTTSTIASFIMKLDEGGESLLDLLAGLRERLGTDELARRVSQIAMASLGEGWPEADSTRFSVEAARTTLRFYAASAIPRPGDVPVDVHHVKFVASLEALEPIAGSAPEKSAILEAAGPAGN